MEIKGMNISPQYKDEILAITVAYKDMVFPAAQEVSQPSVFEKQLAIIKWFPNLIVRNNSYCYSCNNSTGGGLLSSFYSWDN